MADVDMKIDLMPLFVAGINEQLHLMAKAGFPLGKVSDGYHTFDELYAHRISLLRLAGIGISYAVDEYGHYKEDPEPLWRSEYHSDGSKSEGWFIAGIFKEAGKQISYHIPMKEWNQFNHFTTLDRAPEWDGHTSDDVLKRLAEL